MGLIDTGVELYYSFFKISLLLSFLFLIINSVFSWVDMSDIPQVNWETADINKAISSLASAKGLDIAVAIPMLLVSVFALIIQAFLNSLLFVNWGISKGVYLLMELLPISATTGEAISNVLGWLIIAPALVGVLVDIGRIIFYLLYGAVKR